MRDMRRIVLGLVMSAMLLMALLAPAVGDIGDPDAGTKGEEDQPGTPECDWYGTYTWWQGRHWDPWWEYWCWWHGWGWEFVFWVWD